MLILNPNSGRAGAAGELRAWARRHGQAVVDVIGPGEARVQARRGAERGERLVIAAGGDGTIHEVVNGLGGSPQGVTLGIVPLGTGNDLARSLGLPISPSEALGLIESGATRDIDLIRMTGSGTEYIVNAATGGFGVKVEENVSPQAKAMLGPFAYLLAAARSASETQEYRAVLTINGGQTIETDTPNVVIANGRFVGGGNKVAPEAQLDDGRLDLIVVTADTILSRLKVAVEVGTGGHLGSEDVIFHRALRVRVESAPPMPFSLDGEPFEGRPAVEFEVLPGALRVASPSPVQGPRTSAPRVEASRPA